MVLVGLERDMFKDKGEINLVIISCLIIGNIKCIKLYNIIFMFII